MTKRAKPYYKLPWIAVAVAAEGVGAMCQIVAELAYQHSEKKKARNS